MIKKISLSFLALILTYVAAMAISGNQLGFPIANGPSYCEAFGNGGVCNITVPAGPALTGAETIIANTNLAGGGNPQTVLLPVTVMGAGFVNYQVPVAAATVTASSVNESLMLLDPAGTLATLTVVMPGPAASLLDGQTWRLTSSQTITALTLTPGSGTTIGGNAASTPTAITPSATGSTGYEFIYKASNAKWYRLQ